MGSTGRDWKCPWCGRYDRSGYAIDGVNYPICTGNVDDEMDWGCLGLTMSPEGPATKQEYDKLVLAAILHNIHPALLRDILLGYIPAFLAS